MERCERRRRHCKNLTKRLRKNRSRASPSAPVTIFHQVVKPLGSVGGPCLLNLHLKVALGCVKPDSICMRAGRVHRRAVWMKKRCRMWHRSMTSYSGDKEQDKTQHIVGDCGSAKAHLYSINGFEQEFVAAALALRCCSLNPERDDPWQGASSVTSMDV